MANFKVYIDAGHGFGDAGVDPGAVGNGLKEADVTLTVAELLADMLKARGLAVRVNRKRGDKTGLGLNGRINDANACGADIYISIHFNSAAGTAGTGFEIFYYSGGGKSKELAVAIEGLVKAKFTSRGIKTGMPGTTGEFGVIRLTKMPAVLAEGAFINNPSDAAKMKDQGWLKWLAECYGKGICKVLGVKWDTSAQPPKPPAPPPAPGKVYRVQVGAYNVRANAEAMRGRLKKAGFDAVIV